MGVCVSKTCVNNQVGSQDPSTMKLTKPSEDILYKGATVEIECNGIPPNITGIQWFRYGHPILMETPSSVLTLSNLTVSDKGEYMCEVTHQTGNKIKSDAIFLNIKDPPTLELKMPPDEILFKGATAIIFCQSISKKKQKVKWFKNKKEITSSEKHSIGWLDSCPFLRLCNLESDDRGEYSCEVTHQAGFKMTSDEIMIDVKDRTKKMLSVHKELCFKGATLVIKCNPPVPKPKEVIWYRNNIETEKGGRFIEGSIKNPSICIFNLNIGDSGNYKCKITYDFGWAEESMKIHVKDQKTERNQIKEFLEAKTGESGLWSAISKVGSFFNPSDIWSAVESAGQLFMVQRTCMLSIENNANITLVKPKTQGKERNSKPEIIRKGEDTVLKYTTKGTKFDVSTSGVVTYQVQETGERIAIFWGVWKFEDNQFNVEIKTSDANENLYKEMSSTAETAVGKTIEEFGEGYKVTATMSNECKAHLRVLITNNS